MQGLPGIPLWNQGSLHLLIKETLHSLFPSQNLCAKFLLIFFVLTRKTWAMKNLCKLMQSILGEC